ncbi:helix-turn-helix domain-containing protein [Arcanobacterium haemolyticum]|uniref:DNA binding domain protein, excisionase family n=1 Tax=Arcanobacterium haemolyticum (strain ATCC 9345 / DSM 20595 / CCM 5947 / CCUG 17215 / LMG 16163 / NBRC 15585 / NCTC 8452 / 11018) TaxID=644284 RepID=D7BM18_ARCHD|nr:BldC family transcriptional regulator [Arcanobacterium haemolyticum]ADH91967.1 DNA binding domain protein, excisionase family [Arcanobacterium haemolyticum DSM 20595]QCX46148.1 helix-turn-helix domain-containing protein [Arcanobacterium haemolyticum]SPT75727.1 DNA binding domain, excisionase family [Arcanobacterium haemolyticum]SQH29331.1 DNA binding domain, excisionase family [Arcanobacterium haemolyticum]
MTEFDTELMTPAEVAALFRVDPKTVARWSDSGKIPSIRTLGGHRRFRRSDIVAILENNTTEVD